jgi:hypothetical protein
MMHLKCSSRHLVLGRISVVKKLLCAFTVAACLLASACSQASPPQPENPTTPRGPNTVEVTFMGLMVFRQVNDHYEVGVLDSHTAEKHKLGITVGDKPIPDEDLAQYLKTKPWTLSVVNASGNQNPIDIKARQNKPCNRLQDTENPKLDTQHFFDLCWLLDAETELNGGKSLNMNEGLLTPIIHLQNGDLYTKNNFEALDTGVGENPTYSPLGYVSEMIALKVDLNPGEEFVLSAGNQKIFRLAPQGMHNAGVYNQPDPSDTVKSHFDYYYKLFNVPKEERHHIRVSDTVKTKPPNLYIPKKPSDKDFSILENMRFLCFDHELCGAVFLGKSTGPLK